MKILFIWSLSVNKIKGAIFSCISSSLKIIHTRGVASFSTSWRPGWLSFPIILEIAHMTSTQWPHQHFELLSFLAHPNNAYYYKRLRDKKNCGPAGLQVYALPTTLHFQPPWLLMRRLFYRVIISFTIIIFYVWLSNFIIHSKYFPQFWLAKSTRIIHHNQLLMTKFGSILCLTRKWRQKCSPLQVKAPLPQRPVDEVESFWLVVWLTRRATSAIWRIFAELGKPKRTLLRWT